MIRPSFSRFILQPASVAALLVITATATYLLTTLYRTYNHDIPQKELRLSKIPFGQYQIFIDIFIEFTNQGRTTLTYKVVPLELRSRGSQDTVTHLNKGEADLGIIQANTKVEASNVYSIAQVFTEAMFFLSSKAVDSPYKLEEKSTHHPFRVASLQEGSQTYADLIRLLDFLGYKNQRDYIIVPGDYKDGLQLLRRGEVDYAFFISGLGNEDLRNALGEGSGSVRLVPLINLEAFALQTPGYGVYVLPEGLYGKGFRAYRTLATGAVLVCGALDEETVFDLTQDLFERRAQLQARFNLLNLRSITEPSDTFFPTHAGALRYFDRDKPSFLERHPVSIQLLLFFLSMVGYAVGEFIRFKRWQHRVRDTA